MTCEFETDFRKYYEIQLVSVDEKRIVDAATRFDTPFLRPALESVFALDAFAYQNLRKYAFDLIESGSFSAVNPMTGKSCPVSNTFTFDDFLTIFFFVDAENSFALVAGDLSQGFPITNLILFEKRLIFSLNPTFWALKSRHFDILKENGISKIAPVSEPRQICLVAGDPNFAHHAWNELSALEKIVELGLDRRVTLYAFHEALGPINEILGANFNIAGKLAKWQTNQLHGGGRLTFAAGGTLITRNVVDKICTFARTQIDPPLADLLGDLSRRRGRALWVSVRTRNRTMTNQTEVLAAVICAYLRDRPDRVVIMDGHSLPYDHDRDPDFLREANAAVVADDHLTIESVVAAVRETLPDANIVTRCGDKVHESILIAQDVGFYFCHHGTVQHKVGWFASVPGVVHCNRKVLESRPAQWVVDKSEVAIMPTYVPDETIGVFEDFSYDDEIQRNLNVENYFVQDLQKFVSFFLESLVENEILYQI
ncbi:hypothetical protein AWL63_10890 [Sphingomonas panacis]|uniref:Uncharacterized protein n=1 Tax=Sphingomonas panacis TaxID=1560345 RepID=A0A1B3ZAF0_9SPHN|nr:hypothetical protein [Sphingomonas panacis]AOH84397.1 hypothetical protein AWL63_10890 [Sphingomonas panacis]